MSKKHEVNLRKNSVVNFQIGLIATLLFTYVMFEVYTTAPILHNPQVRAVDPPEEYPDFRYRIEEPPKMKEEIAEVKRPEIKDPEEFEVVDDNDESKALEEFVNEPIDDSKGEKVSDLDSGDIIEAGGGDDLVETVPFIAVEFAPVYPGCEKLKTNGERSVCFQEKIKKMVSRKFNNGFGPDLGLHGVQRITVMFEVGTDGSIINIKARAPHPRLEREAIRVAGLLPRMTPGMQRDKPVSVQYALPIVFKIQ